MHTNSGIHNKVAYLLIQGGSFNGYDVQAIGAPRARRLFYYVLTNWLTPNATFREARDAAIGEAQNQQRRGELTPRERLLGPRRAYAAVGIGFPDLNCGRHRPEQAARYLTRTGSQPAPTTAQRSGIRGSMTATTTRLATCATRIGMGTAGSIPTTTARRTGNCGPGRLEPQQGGRCLRRHRRRLCQRRQGQLPAGSQPTGKKIRMAILLGDVCDPDRDGDGWANPVDNCPVHDNPSQADTTETCHRACPPTAWGSLRSLSPGLRP